MDIFTRSRWGERGPEQYCKGSPASPWKSKHCNWENWKSRQCNWENWMSQHCNWKKLKVKVFQFRKLKVTALGNWKSHHCNWENGKSQHWEIESHIIAIGKMESHSIGKIGKMESHSIGKIGKLKVTALGKLGKLKVIALGKLGRTLLPGASTDKIFRKCSINSNPLWTSWYCLNYKFLLLVFIMICMEFINKKIIAGLSWI